MRISNQGMLAKLIDIRTDFQQQISDLGINITTGIRHPALSQYGMQIPILISLSQELTNLHNYTPATDLVTAATKDYDSSLCSMRTLMEDANHFLTTTGTDLPTNPTNSEIKKFQYLMRSQGQMILQQITTYLNIHGINGYGFSGKRTNTIPVLELINMPTWSTRDIVYPTIHDDSHEVNIPFTPIESGPKIPSWTFTDQNGIVKSASYLTAWDQDTPEDSESWYIQHSQVASGIDLNYGITATNQTFQYMIHAALLINTMGKLDQNDPFYKNVPQPPQQQHNFLHDLKALHAQASKELSIALSCITRLIQGNGLISSTIQSIAHGQNTQEFIFSQAIKQIINLNEDEDTFAARYSLLKQGIILSQGFMKDIINILSTKSSLS